MSLAAGISASGRSELAQVLGEGGRFITTDDVVAALGLDRRTSAQKLSRWASEGWLRRVRRGLYIPVPVDAQNPASWAEAAMAVAAAVWSPCYFTGWTAANHWGLTEQVFRTIVVKTSRRVRRAENTMLDQDYLLGHVTDAELSWGMKTIWNDEVKLLIADPARTVIDIFDAPRLAGGIRHGADILRAYLEDNDGTQLIGYGDRLGNRVVFKRLGLLIETLGLDNANLLEACQERLSAGISLLDPDAPDQGRRSMRWRIRENVHLNRVDAS